MRTEYTLVTSILRDTKKMIESFIDQSDIDRDYNRGLEEAIDIINYKIDVVEGRGLTGASSKVLDDNTTNETPILDEIVRSFEGVGE